MTKLFKSLPFRLLLAVVIGILVGIYCRGEVFMGHEIMQIAVTLKYVLGQLITFCVPLIIIAFIAPSITKLGNNASKLLGIAVVLAYISSIGAAFFSMFAGYSLIPHLNIVTDVEGLRELPAAVFQLDIPQIMPVMSALVFSILIGLAASWTKAKTITAVLDEFQKIILAIAMLLTMGVQAQSQQKYQINGNNIVAVSQTKQKKEAQKTSYTYTIKGKTCEVYQGAKGSYYIIRTSAKTGKDYRCILSDGLQCPRCIRKWHFMRKLK